MSRCMETDDEMCSAGERPRLRAIEEKQSSR